MTLGRACVSKAVAHTVKKVGWMQLVLILLCSSKISLLTSYSFHRYSIQLHQCCCMQYHLWCKFVPCLAETCDLLPLLYTRIDCSLDCSLILSAINSQPTKVWWNVFCMYDICFLSILSLFILTLYSISGSYWISNYRGKYSSIYSYSTLDLLIQLAKLPSSHNSR